MNNRKDLRNNFSGLFYSNLINLFADALDQEESFIKRLIDERYTKYSELLTNDEDIKKFHTILIELLMRTKYNTPVSEVEFEYFEPKETDFFCDYPAMIITLSSFENHMIPAIIESIEKFIGMAGY